MTILLVVFYPETKWHRAVGNHPALEKKAEKEAETEAAQEKTADSEAASLAGEGQFLGRGKPSKAQFSPVQKPDSRWITFIVRDLTTPVLVFFNP